MQEFLSNPFGMSDCLSLSVRVGMQGLIFFRLILQQRYCDSSWNLYYIVDTYHIWYIWYHISIVFASSTGIPAALLFSSRWNCEEFVARVNEQVLTQLMNFSNQVEPLETVAAHCLWPNVIWCLDYLSPQFFRWWKRDAWTLRELRRCGRGCRHSASRRNWMLLGPKTDAKCRKRVVGVGLSSSNFSKLKPTWTSKELLEQDLEQQFLTQPLSDAFAPEQSEIDALKAKLQNGCSAEERKCKPWVCRGKDVSVFGIANFYIKMCFNF